MTTKPRGPEVFALEDEKRAIAIREEADFTAQPEAAPEPVAPRRGSWLTRAFWSALGLLVSLFLFDAVWSLILSLQQKSALAGQVGLALIGIIGFVVLVWLLREAFAMMRLRAVSGLREEARAVAPKPSDAEVRSLTAKLVAFYAKDATTAAGRAEIERSLAEIHDPQTRLAIAERALLAAKDETARAMIASAAQRVQLSPRFRRVRWWMSLSFLRRPCCSFASSPRSMAGEPAALPCWASCGASRGICWSPEAWLRPSRFWVR